MSINEGDEVICNECGEVVLGAWYSPDDETDICSICMEHTWNERNALRAEVARMTAERDALKQVVIPLCDEWNCNPNELVAILRREYVEASENVDTIIEMMNAEIDAAAPPEGEA